MSFERSYQTKLDVSSSLFLSDGRLDYRTRERFESELFLDAAEAGAVHFAINGSEPDCEFGVTLDPAAAEELGRALIDAAETAQEAER